MNSIYSLALPGFVVSHSSQTTLTLCDRADPSEPALDALARSGDYFITVATNLEALASELTEISPTAASLTLARLSDELTYMQRHYTLTPKQRPDPLGELG